MVVYDFDEKDIKQIVWELSVRFKDLEEEVRSSKDLKDAVIALQKIVVLLERHGLLDSEFEEAENE